MLYKNELRGASLGNIFGGIAALLCIVIFKPQSPWYLYTVFSLCVVVGSYIYWRVRD